MFPVPTGCQCKPIAMQVLTGVVNPQFGERGNCRVGDGFSE